MFEKFNQSARRALFFSRYEASLLSKREIDSEHILLGLIREGDPVLKELFNEAGVDVAHIRSRFPVPDPPPLVSSSAEIPLSEDGKKVLAYAISECQRIGADEVSPAIVLLGILRVTKSGAANVLAEQGMTWTAVAPAAEALLKRAMAVAEKHERTPLVLRDSHYEILDTLAANIGMPPARRASRQELALAVFDALAETPLPQQEFSSVSEFRDELKKQLSGER